MALGLGLMKRKKEHGIQEEEGNKPSIKRNAFDFQINKTSNIQT